MSSTSARATTTLLVAAAASWGLGTVLSKYALLGFTPAQLLPLQLMVSTIGLGLVLLVRRERVRKVRRPARVAALGVLNPGVAYALGLVGLSQIDASTSVVIWATEPVVIVVLAFALLHERLSAVASVCLATAMGGIVLIVGPPSSSAAVVGVLLTFGAVLACALYSILVRAMDLADGTLPVVWLQQAAALVFALLVYAVVVGVRSAPVAATGWEAGAAALGGITYYGLAFWLYVAGLRRTSAAGAGMHLTLIPVFGLLFSALLLGERLDAVQVLGAVAVIGAMGYLAVSDGRRAETDPPP